MSTISFLKKNGFKRIETNSYANNYCNVIIDNNAYIVADNEGNVHYTDSDFYTLIGYLTWMGYLSRDYKK